MLANGSYSSRRPFLNPFGHHLYAARLGRAVLRAGLSLGGNVGDGGGLVRGVVVDVSDRRRTVGGAAIAVWGTGRNSRILDTRVHGHATLRAGVEAREPHGLVIERLVARGFQDFGVLVDANEPGRRASRPRLPDRGHRRRGRQPADARILRRPCGGMRLDRQHRARCAASALRSCAWSGLWTGTATDGSLFDGIDVDRARTGVYLEHFTHDSVFRRLRIGPAVRVGLTAEWADPAWDSKPASVGNVIEDSRFASSLAGVYLDEGTTRTTVRRSTFVDQAWGGIGDYLGRNNQLYANDFRGLGTKAQAVRHDRLSSTR